MSKQFHPDELALLAAIHAAPRDDTPRLVYADWLQEHGQDEYAEFIRLQCVRPYVGNDIDFPREGGDRPEVRARRKRLNDLLPYAHRVDKPGEFYESHLRGLPLVEATLFGGVRGMSSRVDDLLERVGPAARLDLTIEFLDPDRLADWLASPVMDRVDVLTLSPDPDFNALHLDTLAESRVLDRLHELNLMCTFTPELWALAGAAIQSRVPIGYTY